MIFVIVVMSIWYMVQKQWHKQTNQQHISKHVTQENTMSNNNHPIITPIKHASFILNWDNTVLYADPVGGMKAYQDHPAPNIIILTDIHSDHLSVETLEAVAKENTTIIAPQAVADQLPESLKMNIHVMANGEVFDYQKFQITAIPMYNLTESDNVYHPKGRGNGYVIEHQNKRVYISGDTAGIPEMRALKDIDIAFVCMNFPYTMDINAAAEAVLEFKPKQVIPYHYRGTDGLSDVDKFKEIVTQANPQIDVELLTWY